MTLSVALCTFNGARFVAQQVRSILAQERPVDEIVVSDDGSTDGTVEIVEKTVSDWRAAGRRPPLALRVLRNPSPLGVTANFEQAILACSGDLVALCDQDDLWHPAKTARLVAALENRREVALVASNARLVGADGTPAGTSLFQTLALSPAERDGVRGDRAFEVLLRRNTLTGATMILRRELAEAAAPFPEAWVHDEWLAVVAAATASIDVIDDELIDYRQHGANQIGATSLTGSGRVQRLRTPRSERNARLLARAAALSDRLPSVGAVPPERLALAEQKLEHERVRSALPAGRLRRVAPVLREWRTGRYASCGLGAQDVLRDLVQPV